MCIEVIECNVSVVFETQCTSRAYATMSVSVCLSGCLCYLLTTPHPDRRMGWCQNFWWKREEGYWKIGNCSGITYFTYFLSMDRKHVTSLFIWTMLTLGIFYFSNLGRKSIVFTARLLVLIGQSYLRIYRTDFHACQNSKWSTHWGRCSICVKYNRGVVFSFPFLFRDPKFCMRPETKPCN